jgi:hypothetical protein
MNPNMATIPNSEKEVLSFNSIVQFILAHGDRETYCNMYNNNPHYELAPSVQVYLNPSIGQKNINCDPSISTFNEIVVRDLNSQQQYYIVSLAANGKNLKWNPARKEAFVYFEQLRKLAQKK